MKKRILFPILFAFHLLLPTKTLAWGKNGHALAAEVAFNYLDRNTKKIVLGYLMG